MDEDLFYTLSVVLTGEPTLHRPLVGGLLQRLRSVPEAAHLDRLAAVYSAILADVAGDEAKLIGERILDDRDLRTLVKLIVVLWYTGELTNSPMSEDEHFQGIVWRVASAHPPGLSGGYFGHWTYPPDNG